MTSQSDSPRQLIQTEPTPRRRSRRRWTIGLLFTLAVVAAMFAWHVRTRLAESPRLRTVQIQQRDLRIAIATSGTVEPQQVVEVGALVAGNIMGFGNDIAESSNTVEVGTPIAKGSVLVQLDSALYEVELQKAEAANRLAEAEVARLRTQLQQAQRDRQRAELLRSTNSESQFDKAVTAHEMAQSELAIAQARQQQAMTQVKQAQINLQRTTIRSPIDGVILDRRANLGQRVGPSDAGLFLLTHDLQKMRIRASVSETDIGHVYVGQPVTFTVDAHRDQVQTGCVEKILMNARVEGNFVTYDVLVSIDGTTESLLPHMTADVQLERVNRRGAWLVPGDALQWWPSEKLRTDTTASLAPSEGATDLPAPSEGQTAMIWVPTANGRVRGIKVRVGINDGVQTEVIGDALSDGMPVVVGTVRETTLARIIPHVKTLR